LLNFTDKLREKELCDPNEAVQYIIAENKTLFKKNKTDADMDIFNKEQAKNLQASKLICSLSKRKLISDVDFLSKEIKINMLSNYVSLIKENIT
jgi:hypothetical protein